MGLIKAAIGAVGGALADQWKDFLTVPPHVASTAALFPAFSRGASGGRGSNVQGSHAILTNGSKVVVPPGYGLILFQDGEPTGFTDEPGGYIWNSEDINSRTIYSQEGGEGSLVAQSWERFKFGGRPSSQQLALFVNLKELPNNKFGTRNAVYWDDAYLNSQVGARTHGKYSMHIVDPILFVSNFVPAAYLQGIETFDFTDRSNAASSQLLAEVVGSLSSAFSIYTNDGDKEHRIAKLQRDSVGFARSLSEAVERAYHWRSTRGLAISNATILGIDYDDDTRDLLKIVQRADALAGSRGDANLRASAAAGIEASGGHSGAEGILGLGIAAGSVGLSDMLHRRTSPNSADDDNAGEATPDLIASLDGLRRALAAGLINQAEHDAAKAKLLGLS